ncbi:MAG: heavy-metal-associated domain-containing protein [Chloroflexi bacterium]|nr:heavy-metal-associated domain-containing protein [Chloroflexota bacterium]
METVTLRAPDISCDHCVRTIKKAISELPGVRKVDASAATKVVQVTYDPAQLTRDRIETTLADEGYPVAK